MGRPSIAALLLLGSAIASCGTVPAPSEPPVGGCARDLPARTSPAGHPLPVLHVAGDDLPPVVEHIEWRGGGAPIATSAPRPVHLSRFTVVQVNGATELSLRLTDGLEIAAWRVTAIPDTEFRIGDTDAGTEWSSGEDPTPLVCVPLADGEWAIRADLTFADDGGEGTFYWRINAAEAASG